MYNLCVINAYRPKQDSHLFAKEYGSHAAVSLQKMYSNIWMITGGKSFHYYQQ